MNIFRRMAICGNDNGVVLSILPTEKKKDFSLNFSLDDTQQEVIRRRYGEKADGLTSIPIPNEDLFDVNNKFIIGNDLSLEMKVRKFSLSLTTCIHSGIVSARID